MLRENMKSTLTVSQLFICLSSTATFTDEAAEKLESLLSTGEANVEAAEAVHKIVGFASAIDLLPWQYSFSPAASDQRNSPSRVALERQHSSESVTLHAWKYSFSPAASNQHNSPLRVALKRQPSLESVTHSIEDVKHDVIALIFGLPDFVFKSPEFKSLWVSEDLNELIREFFRNAYQGSFAEAERLTFSNGDFYWGEVKNGQREGFGREQYINGGYFEGLHVNNERNGFGVSVSSRNHVYCGYFRSDIVEGLGYYRWPGGGRYFGRWLKGLRHGEGIQSNSDGSIFFGLFEEGNFKAGFYLWPADKSNRCCGPFSQLYIGSFSNGYLDGQGKIWCRDGSFYEGGFEQNENHGEGYLTLPGGQPKKVQFEHGVLLVPATSTAFGRFRKRVGKSISNFRQYGMHALRNTNSEGDFLVHSN